MRFGEVFGFFWCQMGFYGFNEVRMGSLRFRGSFGFDEVE